MLTARKAPAHSRPRDARAPQCSASSTSGAFPASRSALCSSSMPDIALSCSAVFHFPSEFTFTACSGTREFIAVKVVCTYTCLPYRASLGLLLIACNKLNEIPATASLYLYWPCLSP